ncbi:MAG: sensor histidine kinase [Bullifex sp.]
MNRTIFRAILLTSVLIMIFSLAATLLAVNSNFEKAEEDRLRAEIKVLKSAVEEGGLEYLESLDVPDFRITWIEDDGEVLFDDSVTAGELGDHSDRQEVRMARLYGYGSSRRYSSTLSTKTIYAAGRLDDGSVIRVSVTQNTILLQFLSLIPSMLIVFLISVLVAVVVSRKLSQRIISPLNSLDLDRPLGNDTYEELSPLLVKIDGQQKEIAFRIRELEARRKEFAEITGNMSEALILINGEENIVTMNRSACALFGADEKAVGKSVLTLERSLAFINAVRKAEGGVRSELRYSRNGQEYSLVISPIMDGGKFLGSCLLFLDITDKARAEDMRREFSANVSHELKTPLQTILASSELLSAGVVKKEDEKEFLERIHREASRLVSLINDCISISELDEDAPMQSEDVRVRKIISEVTDTLAGAAQERGIKILCDADDMTVKCVPHLFYEIVYNLVDNAIRYNKPDGEISITLRMRPEGIILKVRDTGIGVPRESLERIFERFYRVDKSHSRSSGGTGLGLSIVKHAVLYHGGMISAESEMGKWTEITAVFPLSMAVSDRAVNASAQELP